VGRPFGRADDDDPLLAADIIYHASADNRAVAARLAGRPSGRVELTPSNDGIGALSAGVIRRSLRRRLLRQPGRRGPQPTRRGRPQAIDVRQRGASSSLYTSQGGTARDEALTQIQALARRGVGMLVDGAGAAQFEGALEARSKTHGIQNIGTFSRAAGRHLLRSARPGMSRTSGHPSSR